MDISWKDKRRLLAPAALAAALCVAGVPGYGGAGAAPVAGGREPAAGSAQERPGSDGNDGLAADGHGGGDSYHIINLVPGTGYRSRMNTRGQVAFEYVSLADRLHVGFFDGDRASDINPPGADTAALGDMNEQAEVVEHAALPYGEGFNLRPFRWSQTAGWTLLPSLSADGSTATEGLNNHGVAAGESVSGSGEPGNRAVRWDTSNRLSVLPIPAGLGQSSAGNINKHGVIVGTAYDAAGLSHAVTWDGAGRLTDLGTLGARTAAAQLNNNRGDIAGFLNLSAADFQAFVWSPGTGVAPAGLHTVPGELNNVGELVGRIYNPDTGYDHAYVFSRARGLVDLQRAPFTSSNALHVDDRGTVVGQMSSNIIGDMAQRAYRWSRSGEAVDLNTRLLDVPDGLVVTEALRISAKGDILANSNAGLLLLRRAGGTDAPLLGPIRIPDVVQPAQPIALTLSFRDRNKRDIHSATVDWGDGSGLQAAGISERNGVGALSAAHTYASIGDYTAIVRLTDATGRVTTQARYVHVFQPCVPGIVGEGSLASARGSAAQPTLVFRLAAPLVSRCGNTRPLTFVMQGRIAFEGERLERVSRSGNTVRLEGSGKLGGKPGYHFTIEARDGQYGGASDTDRMTVRIDHAGQAGAALAGTPLPPVFSYGLAEKTATAAPAAREGNLPPTGLRLIE